MYRANLEFQIARAFPAFAHARTPRVLHFSAFIIYVAVHFTALSELCCISLYFVVGILRSECLFILILKLFSYTAGTYGGKEARLYSMVVSNTEASGSIFDKENDKPDNDVNTNTGT